MYEKMVYPFFLGYFGYVVVKERYQIERIFTDKLHGFAQMPYPCASVVPSVLIRSFYFTMEARGIEPLTS